METHHWCEQHSYVHVLPRWCDISFCCIVTLQIPLYTPTQVHPSERSQRKDGNCCLVMTRKATSTPRTGKHHSYCPHHPHIITYPHIITHPHITPHLTSHHLHTSHTIHAITTQYTHENGILQQWWNLWPDYYDVCTEPRTQTLSCGQIWSVQTLTEQWRIVVVHTNLVCKNTVHINQEVWKHWAGYVLYPHSSVGSCSESNTDRQTDSGRRYKNVWWINFYKKNFTPQVSSIGGENVSLSDCMP